MKSVPWGPIGEIIALRTYNRWLPEKRRREYWDETIRRVVDYSLSLGPTYEGEGEELFNLWYSLKGAPAGRTLWIGGIPISRTNPEANFNCAFERLDDAKALHDMQLLLMSGAGVGFRVTQDVIANLNVNLPLGRKPEVKIVPYSFYGYDDARYSEHTRLAADGDGIPRLVVGDSREGWADAIKLFLELISSGLPQFRIDLNSVRPQGERLKRFGGYASGPEPLKEFFEYALLVLFDENRPHGWTDTKALDVVNLIARATVAGGTRRSAQIGLGDSDEFARAKTGRWATMDEAREWLLAGAIPEGVIPAWRSQSNNSLLFWEKPSKTQLADLMESILQYGEPGFINAEEANRRRRGEFEGVNPCVEIVLRNKGFCNLTTTNMVPFAYPGGFDKQELFQALRLATRHAMRITNVRMGERLADWDKVQQEDRLIGVSFTGLMDAAAIAGYSLDDLKRLWQEMRAIVHKEAEDYARYMGIPTPKLATTVKPEGTWSLLPGVSAGIHDAYAPYYIRRVRMSKDDAVAQALIKQGFKYEEDLFAPNTYVFEFPVATPAKRSANEVPALEMLERYKASMEYWTDHNTSITVAVADDEVDDVIDWLDRNWDSIVGISFLRKDTSVYPQQPYEEITEEQYLELKAKTPKFDRRVLDQIEGGFGLFMAVDDIESDCDSGHCPVR